MAAKRIVVALLASLLLASSAHAAGIGLAWTSCEGDFGTHARTFACNSNLGSDRLVASFVLAAGITGVSGVIAHLDLGNAGPTLPAWWELLNPGTCRQTGATSSGDPPIGSVACLSWSNGLASSAFTYTIGALGPNTAALRSESVVQVANLASLSANQEYGAVTLTINHAKTVGLGACGGCSTPVCLVLTGVDVFTGGPTPAITLTNPAHPTTGNVAFWQAGVGVPNLPSGCTGAVPVHGSTWGAVKSLYR